MGLPVMLILNLAQKVRVTTRRRVLIVGRSMSPTPVMDPVVPLLYRLVYLLVADKTSTLFSPRPVTWMVVKSPLPHLQAGRPLIKHLVRLVMQPPASTQILPQPLRLVMVTWLVVYLRSLLPL